VSLGVPIPLVNGVYVFIADDVDACCRENNKNPCIFFDYLTISSLLLTPLNPATILAPLCQKFIASASQPFIPDALLTDADFKFLATATTATTAKCPPVVFNVYSPPLIKATTGTFPNIITYSANTIANLNSSNFLGKVYLQIVQPTTPNGRISLMATSVSNRPILIPSGAMFVSEGCCCDGDIQIIQFH